MVIFFQLKLGDVCISLTHRPQKTSSPATEDTISERHKTSLETSQIADGKRDFLTSQIADLKRDFQIGEMRPPPAPPADRERHRSRFETIYN